MMISGNVNILRHPSQPRQQPRTASVLPALPPAAAVVETQLLGEQRWPQLTVQLFAEPAHVAPAQLPPPSQLRLLLLLSGKMHMQVRGAGRDLTYTSQPGTIKLTTPHHQPYEMEWAALTPDPVRSAHLYVPPGLLARTAEAGGLDPARIELAEGCNIPDPLLYQLGHALAQEAAGNPERESLFAETASQLLAAQLLRQHCTFALALPDHRGKLSASQLRRVRDYVRAHLHQAIQLEDLAALVFLSPYHFCRVFKRTTGLTPNQFVIGQRMERATELLRYSDLSVKQVAAAVGYGSHAHFTQLFARHTGQLPLDLTRTRPV